MASTRDLSASLRAAILALLGRRGAGKSICPSAAARLAQESDWRALMPMVIRTALNMAKRSEIEITQRGRAVGASARPKGALRLRLK